MNISIKGFITCKGAESYSDCADYYSHNLNNHKFSISDGVSKSFFPKFWSRALANTFVDSAFGKENLVEKAQQIWQTQIEEIVNEPDVKWFTRAAYNRKTPGLATFVGLQFVESEAKWKASAIGDSFLFFVPHDFEDFDRDVTKLSSKADPVMFDNFPDYLSSIGKDHKGTIHSIEQDFQDGNFYLMTDALAEWFSIQKEEAVKTIDAWNDQTEFEDFISTQRKNDNLTDDDSAILIIKIENSTDQNISYSSIEIRDLDQLIKHQVEELKKNEELQEILPEAENPSKIGQESKMVSEEFNKDIAEKQGDSKYQDSFEMSCEELKEQNVAEQEEHLLSDQEEEESSHKEEDNASAQVEIKVVKKEDEQIIFKPENTGLYKQEGHEISNNQHHQELNSILEEQHSSKDLTPTEISENRVLSEKIIIPTVSEDMELAEKQEEGGICNRDGETVEVKERSKIINTVARLITNKF